jgi:hypothetical protein
VKPRLDRTLLSVTILLVALLAAACTSGDDPEPSTSAAASQSVSSEAALPSAAASEAGGDGEETSVFDLEVGDCFSESEEQLETVTVVDCETAHVYEVYHVFDHEAGGDEEYPGDEEILEYADTECQVPFEDFIGLSYEESQWFITSVTPSQETWDTGDREIVCTVNLEDGSEVTGSAEGSAE